MPAEPPTIALAPRLPVSGSAMCIEPPLPRQYPGSLPRSSANMRLTDAPLARQWPCPRCVLVMKSSRRSASHAHGHALLADIEVGEARHLRALVQLVHLLLEGANLRHLPIKVEVLLEVEPGFGGLGRHPHPPMGLRGCVS